MRALLARQLFGGQAHGGGGNTTPMFTTVFLAGIPGEFCVGFTGFWFETGPTPPDTTPPVIGSASINAAGTTLTVNFTEAGSPPVLPASGVSGFSISGSQASIASGTISGTTGTFTLNGKVLQGQTITLSYTPGNVTDSAIPPNAMVAVSGVAVTNNSTYTDTTPPVISRAAVSSDGKKVYVYLTETESPPCLPASSVTGFSLSGTTATIASGTISGNTVTLSLSGAVLASQTVTVSYSSVSGNVTDSATVPNAMQTAGPIAAPMAIGGGKGLSLSLRMGL